MPDITMCTGDNSRLVCPVRETCYRYTATPNSHWQSYMKAPIVDAEEVCKHYWMDRPSQGLGVGPHG